MKRIQLFACIIALAMLPLFALADSAVSCRAADGETNIGTNDQTGILTGDVPLGFI